MIHSNPQSADNIIISTIFKPFTPDRPTHSIIGDTDIKALIKSVDANKFLSERQVSIKQYQEGNLVVIASRFNNTWYVNTGRFR